MLGMFGLYIEYTVRTKQELNTNMGMSKFGLHIKSTVRTLQELY
jgi:hypothetical protein